MLSRKPSSAQQGQAPRASRFWSALGGLDLLIGALLGAMLVPLIIGPFVLVYEFIKAGQHGLAALIGAVFAACVALAVRGAHRGEFGPGTLAAVLVLLGLMLLVATRLRG